MRGVRRVLLVSTCLGAALAVVPAVASASNLIDRNATRIKLQVNKENVALLSYRVKAGPARRVVAWGALNAIAPSTSLPQQGFKVQYLGVQGPIRTDVVKGTFVNSCKRYTGPKIPWMVAACTAPDGSWWALQSWQRPLPNYGEKVRNPDLAATELRLSHWRGELPLLTVKQDWSFGGQWEHFYGSYTYLGKPMFGFKTTSYGAPLDKFGVLIYLDVFNSNYGKGWKRENSFVTHNPTGIWCYSLNPHGSRPAGAGQKYRMTAQSPGALPDVLWQGRTLGKFNPELDAKANEEQQQSYSDGSCKPN